MAMPPERMRKLREQRRARDLRELRLLVPDARPPNVRRRVARQVATLTRDSDALKWIEAVAELDADEARSRHGLSDQS
jgi:hypothetical protein